MELRMDEMTASHAQSLQTLENNLLKQYNAKMAAIERQLKNERAQVL